MKKLQYRQNNAHSRHVLRHRNSRTLQFAELSRITIDIYIFMYKSADCQRKYCNAELKKRK